MKKRIIMTTLILSAGLLYGCGGEETHSNAPNMESESSQPRGQSGSESEEETEDTENSEGTENSKDSESPENSENTENSESTENTGNTDIAPDDELRIDFTCDYTEAIKADVDHAVSVSASLQQELENMEKIIQKYTPLAEAAQTQGEMNVSSKWFFVIWDTELNSLWSRFTDAADQQIKEKVLAEQRNWIAMKEEAALLSIGSREEGGSIYPLLYNSFLENITKNRAYVLANELAVIKGEAFVMPEISEENGLFVDNQGTDSVYSILRTWQNQVGENEAVISVYRQGEIEGSFVNRGNGELAFTSYDGSVKGIIEINGWDGACFRVTETSGESAFSVGDEVEFPFVF